MNFVTNFRKNFYHKNSILRSNKKVKRIRDLFEEKIMPKENKIERQQEVKNKIIIDIVS